MNQSDSPRPTQVSYWGWIRCKQMIMIRYLVKSLPIRSFWSGLQTGEGSTNHRAARSPAWQTRLRAVSPESWCEVDLVCPKVWSLRRFSVSPESTSQENSVSPQSRVQVWSVENLVGPESPKIWSEKSWTSPEWNSSGLGRTKGCPKSRSEGNPVGAKSWCEDMLSILSQESTSQENHVSPESSGVIWGKLSRSWV